MYCLHRSWQATKMTLPPSIWKVGVPSQASKRKFSGAEHNACRRAAWPSSTIHGFAGPLKCKSFALAVQVETKGCMLPSTSCLMRSCAITCSSRPCRFSAIASCTDIASLARPLQPHASPKGAKPAVEALAAAPSAFGASPDELRGAPSASAPMASSQGACGPAPAARQSEGSPALWARTSHPSILSVTRSCRQRWTSISNMPHRATHSFAP
mmetsp:Transcript_64698/g.182401  ORF Transcript_64698/g.182401 Transcript_64698/m.182401 type:complete len:212 (+) Transcript_64698:486-1121(+)